MWVKHETKLVEVLMDKGFAGKSVKQNEKK
jgi:hypothetical protein